MDIHDFLYLGFVEPQGKNDRGFSVSAPNRPLTRRPPDALDAAR
jgi:hypothetical protein